jgi:hypothetical protein
MADPLKDMSYLTLLAKGFVGQVAVNFCDYVKKNYKVYKAKDILKDFSRIADDFKGMQAVESQYYADILIEHVRENGELSKAEARNLFEFVKTISKEAASAFWCKFSSNEKGQEELRAHALKWLEAANAGAYLTSIIDRKQAVK